MRLPLLTASLLSAAWAAQLTLNLAAHEPLLANPSQLPSSTHATLLGQDGTLQSSRLDRQNNIHFSSLPAGSHLLSVFTRDLVYPQYRVDVAPLASSSARESIEVVQTFRGNAWDNKGPKFGAGNDTLTVAITPVARRDFYTVREGFSVLSLLKNPMILMAIFSAALVFGMPYLMDNMDEEAKAEFEQAQKSNPLANGQAAALQNFDFAGWLAGSGPSKSTTPAAEKKAGAASLR